MTAVAEQLKPTLAGLSADDRREIMAFLADLNGDGELTTDEWEDAWVAECERRSAEIRAGTVTMIPAEDVMARMKARFG